MQRGIVATWLQACLLSCSVVLLCCSAFELPVQGGRQACEFCRMLFAIKASVLEGCQLRCNEQLPAAAPLPRSPPRRNYCASTGPDEGGSPDEGNIMLAGNGLQLNTAQGQYRERGCNSQSKPPSDCRKLKRQERGEPTVQENFTAASRD